MFVAVKFLCNAKQQHGGLANFWGVSD